MTGDITIFMMMPNGESSIEVRKLIPETKVGELLNLAAKNRELNLTLLKRCEFRLSKDKRILFDDQTLQELGITTGVHIFYVEFYLKNGDINQPLQHLDPNSEDPQKIEEIQSLGQSIKNKILAMGNNEPNARIRLGLIVKARDLLYAWHNIDTTGFKELKEILDEKYDKAFWAYQEEKEEQKLTEKEKFSLGVQGVIVFFLAIATLIACWIFAMNPSLVGL